MKKSYYQDRLELYGITEQLNSVDIRQTDLKTGESILTPIPLFKEHPEGIEITPVSIDRLPTNYAKEGSRWKKNTYSIIRLSEPKELPNGDVMKYRIPKGAGTPPFFPPDLIAAFEAKAKIKTLYITEGYFKAFKAYMHGIPCVGLVSITTMRDKRTGKMHDDILQLIEVCKVQRLVFLTDADARQITSKPLTENIDISRRVNSFYSAINTFHEITSKIENVKFYFAHITEDLPCKSKGLDDLLINNPDQVQAIADEAASFDRMTSNKHQGQFFTKFNITYGLASVRQYFNLNDVTQFYLYHVERRLELKDKDFKFYGSIYRYDEKEGKCVIKVPATAKDYFRVGDNYYQHINIPNRYGELAATYHQRKKGTILDDHGKGIFEHISKYKSFCNVPDHINYQRVIHNCYNTYHEFTHTPEPGDYDNTLNFIKHIFGTDTIQLSEGQAVPRYELGLDYLTLLYKQPQHILPILCLVSKKRQTGKTTFAKWLKLIYKENMAIVGNQDFDNSFNAHWITKLIACVDETKIDKEHVVEKIKSLSTSHHQFMNTKGVNQVEVEIFLKFILLSNNEDNFINVDKEEIRFWVINVPPIPDKLVPNLEALLADEIPAFLHFLNTRKMVTQYEERHWFNTEYLRTDALAKLQENSAPTLWKILKGRIEQFFLEHDFQELKISHEGLKDLLLKGFKNYEDLYIKKILKDNGYTLGATGRGTYPRLHEEHQADGTIHKKYQTIHFHSRYYTFKRSDFTSEPGTVQLELAPATDNETIQDIPF